MAGTDRDRKLITGGPAIVLVEPQLGENIGMVARAMANFGLSELRIVNPRDGWPSEKARAAASKADHVIDGATVHDDLPSAIADLQFVFATTARERDVSKLRVAEHNTARLCRLQCVAGALRDQRRLFLGQGRIQMQHERIGVGAEFGDDERDLVSHEAADTTRHRG